MEIFGGGTITTGAWIIPAIACAAVSPASDTVEVAFNPLVAVFAVAVKPDCAVVTIPVIPALAMLVAVFSPA